ncbi:MAG: hypothetical protein NTZ09_03295 [Candidatus Hydrogenedentes bacterium]|nr:hypothetical protein [Candidatus Hydrogenedentota bacterium]
MEDGDDSFNPQMLIHETGHALGLPDYYDYDKKKGIPGGLGKLDMMDNCCGNHNAFSRWLLDWIQPEIISVTHPSQFVLDAAGSQLGDRKAIAIFPGIVCRTAPLGEFFLVENRFQVGADGGRYGLPGSGLLIWHVDACLDESGKGFKYDNSYTDRKLIRLMRGGKPEDFDAEARGDASDYFIAGMTFSSDTTPNSWRYDGAPSGVTIYDIVFSADKISLATKIDEGVLAENVPLFSATASPPVTTFPLDVIKPSQAPEPAADRTAPQPTDESTSRQVELERLRTNINDLESRLLTARAQTRALGEVLESTPQASVPDSWEELDAGIRSRVEFDNTLSGITSGSYTDLLRWLPAGPQASPVEPATPETTKGEDVFNTLDALNKELSNAGPERLKTLWDQKKSQPEPLSLPSKLELQIILTNWAAKDGENAVNALNSLTDSDFKKQTYPLLMEAWVNSCPQAASDWYRSKKKTEYDPGVRFAAKYFEHTLQNNPNVALRDFRGLQHPNEQTGALLALADYGKDNKDERLLGKVQQTVANNEQLRSVCGIGLDSAAYSSGLREASEQFKTIVKDIVNVGNY